MDDKTKKICDLLTLIVVCFTFVPLFLINVEHQLGIFIIFLLLFCSLLIRSFFVGERFLNQYNWEKPLLFLEFFLVTVIVLLDRSTLSQILYYILIADAVLFYNLRFSLPYTALIIVSFTLSFYLRGYYEDWSQLLLGGLVNSLSFIFVFLLFYMLRHQIEQRNLIARTRDEIEHKNKQLQEAFNSLEEMAILRERNRIAREVHDTIGHTLTTVLMGLEARRRLLDDGLGLFDMSGNVWEWCFTRDGDRWIQRGGSWNNSSRALQVGFIFKEFPNMMDNTSGFRLVRRP